MDSVRTKKVEEREGGGLGFGVFNFRGPTVLCVSQEGDSSCEIGDISYLGKRDHSLLRRCRMAVW